jgi:hypothetical protein
LAAWRNGLGLAWLLLFEQPVVAAVTPVYSLGGSLQGISKTHDGEKQLFSALSFSVVSGDRLVLQCSAGAVFNEELRALHCQA